MILAIDLGTTSFKAAVFDARLRPVRSRAAPLRHRYGRGGLVELDVATVNLALRSALPDLAGVTAVAITSQAQTFTVLDSRGRPTRPFSSWQDGRAAAASRLLARRLPDFAEHASFGDVLPGLLVSQLQRAPARRGEAVAPLPAYLVRLLTGEAVIDDNLAAMSGLYSLRLRDWWPAVAEPTRLPRVIPVGSVAGLTRRNRLGLPAGIPVVLAGNDQTAGAYGARLHETGGVLLTLGTAQVAYACRPRLPRPRAGTIRGPYPGGRAYQMVADGWGGNLVNWAQTVLQACATPGEFFAAAARAPEGSRGLKFDADAGTWTGLGLHHGPADLARSILECLSRRLARRCRVLTGGRRVPLRAAGGGASRRIWREILARELGQTLRATSAAPLLGAARMAAAP